MAKLPLQLQELTSIRAFAALVVVLFHLFFSGDTSAGVLQTLIADGHLGVDLFFMLSGFILSHVYLQAWREGRFSYAAFLRNRFARLYPLHLVMLLLFVAAYQIFRLLGGAVDAGVQNWSHFVWHLGLLHAWGLTDGHSWNYPSWSVSAEAFAYLLFPLTIVLALRLPVVMFGCAALLLFGAASIIALEVEGTPITKLMFNFGILRVIVEFIIGVAIYLLMERHRLPDSWIRPTALLSLGTVVTLSMFQADERLIVLALALLLTAVAHMALQDRATFLRHPWLVYLGEISYATYMVHILALTSVRSISEKIGFDGSVVASIATLIAIYAGSVVLYHTVERPGRRLLRA
ncbi:MAG: acyltransferase [Pseudomonadota bacterium]